MATENPVYQVLVASGNQAILGNGLPVSSLKNGQLGIFNYHTGLSVDGNTIGECRDIVLAVGINRTSGGTANMEDYRKSSGQLIQVRNTKAVSVKAYIPETAKVVDITGYTAKCETEYLVKIEFKTQVVYGVYGYTQFTKTYSYYTGCCAQDATCDDCSSTIGDPADLANGIMTAINADPDALVTASLVANRTQSTVSGTITTGTATFSVGTSNYSVTFGSGETTTTAAAKIAAAINASTTGGYTATSSGAVVTVYPKKGVSATTTVPVTVTSAGGTALAMSSGTTTSQPVTDSAAFAASYPGAAPTIRITGNAEVRPSPNGSINIKYHKTGTNFDAYMIEGFDACNGTVTVVTQLQYLEGSGYDVRQLEYVAGGWNGQPGVYRQSEVTGLQKSGFEHLATSTSNYTMMALMYDQFSVGGWLEYLNNLMTYIAIPCADTTTLTGLATIFDKIFTQFSPLADDVASIACSGASNVSVNLINDYTKDGIESLG